MIMTWSPTLTVRESAMGLGFMSAGTRSSWRSERSAPGSEAMTRAGTCAPPTASTVISSMAFTTCAAVITLPSAVTSTPDPVSLKRVTPMLLTSRPFARITTTEGLTLLNSSFKFCACAMGTTTCSTVAPSRAARSLFMELGRPVVRELQRHPQILRLDEGDDGLEIVAVLARYAQLILLDGGLDAYLGILDEAYDLLGLVHGNYVWM